MEEIPNNHLLYINPVNNGKRLHFSTGGCRISGCHQQYHHDVMGVFPNIWNSMDFTSLQPWRLGICLVATTAMAIPSSAGSHGCAGPTLYGALYLSFSHRVGSELWKEWGEACGTIGKDTEVDLHKQMHKKYAHIYTLYIYDIYIYMTYIYWIYVVVIVVGIIIYVVIDTTTWLSRRAKLDQIKTSRSPNKETSIFAVLFRLHIVTKLLGKVCRQFRFTNCSRVEVRDATPMDSPLLRSFKVYFTLIFGEDFFN